MTPAQNMTGKWKHQTIFATNLALRHLDTV